MKSQARRDEEAVTIVAGLLLFLLITVLGGVALLVVDRLVAIDQGLRNVLFYAVLGVAAFISLSYIRRSSGAR